LYVRDGSDSSARVYYRAGVRGVVGCSKVSYAAAVLVVNASGGAGSRRDLYVQRCMTAEHQMELAGIRGLLHIKGYDETMDIFDHGCYVHGMDQGRQWCEDGVQR
jgi:hypothetical protein